MNGWNTKWNSSSVMKYIFVDLIVLVLLFVFGYIFNDYNKHPPARTGSIMSFPKQPMRPKCNWQLINKSHVNCKIQLILVILRQVTSSLKQVSKCMDCWINGGFFFTDNNIVDFRLSSRANGNIFRVKNCTSS